MNKSQKTEFYHVQGLLIISGFFLFSAGVLSAFAPNGNLLSIAFLLGLAMFFAGAINILLYTTNKNTVFGSRLLLAEGLSTSLLALFPLFNKIILPEILPFFFGVWELFSGILKTIDASELKTEKIKGRQWLFSIGIIELLSGIASMVKPIDDLVGENIVVAIIFFVQTGGHWFKILVFRYLNRK